MNTETTFKLYEQVALSCDLPEKGLKQGDIATLIDFVPHPTNGEKGAILEVFNEVGDSIAVIAIPLSKIKTLSSNEKFI